MAQKRMFDKSIIETDSFLNISLSAKALYFLLGMECDDEGFVSPNRVLRLYGGEMGDIKNLVDVGLVIRFKSGVLVITDWNQNNYLDKNRIKPTQHQKEKQMLLLTIQGKYELNNGSTLVQPEESSIEESRGEQNTSMFEEWWKEYPSERRNLKKDDARKKFERNTHEEQKQYLKHLKEQKAKDRKWLEGFVPNMSTYINQERWNMAIEETRGEKLEITHY